MHKDVINAALALSTIIRFLDDEQIDIFMKYIDFMRTKAVAGEIVDADAYIEAIEEFALSLDLDEEE
ncbi:hypothetical protein SEA_ANNIHILUS_27 [Streptomyces phage Annihilus]|nr:hypothetical protein SEA_MOOZY_27 [Streptomyces phage Moozy]UQT02474.1 hypothetical protein SEA_ANNIHILUS_27 [Streptomyces phage Annihilus]